MADVRCPMCGKPNPGNLEECQFCGARLKPVISSQSEDTRTIKPGEEPVKRKTSEFEKVNLSRGAPIRPGEAPTWKNTADLEGALPPWLRSLREENSPAEDETMPELSGQESHPVVPKTAANLGSSAALPDLLSGLNKSVSEDEEIPDWLAGLRSAKSDEIEPTPTAEDRSTTLSIDPDWTARIGNPSPEPPSESLATPRPPASEQPGSEPSSEPGGADYSPEWLKNLQSPPSGTQGVPAFIPSPETAWVDDSSGWVKTLQSSSTASQEASASEKPPESAGGDDSPEWLKNLQSPLSGSKEPPAVLQGGDNEPEWLSGLPGISPQSRPTPPGTKESARTENTPDWLDQFNQKSIPPESAARPDPGASLPDWLSNLEGKSEPDSGIPVTGISRAPRSSGNPSADSSNWLSQLKTDGNAAANAQQHKSDSEVVPAGSASVNEIGPLPDWLVGITTTTPTPRSTPALIGDKKENPSGEQVGTAYSLEIPDWLSKINPEQASEKPSVANEDQVDSGTLVPAELPSWVQAMRPVESVVESKTATLEENQGAEQNGPLAGLTGVLPAEPGLGFLRKPPSYSTNLQVSDGQHHYADTLEKLIAGETNPRPPKAASLSSNQLLRWLITALLLLAVGLPFLLGGNKVGGQIAPATSLASSDQGASTRILNGLTGKIPALVVFDYDPALSGELEAVAAPLMDQLLSKRVPLAVISTSPTGPILAEHFLQTAPLVKDHLYQSGNQYINLGYLAGGSAGILFFAYAPTEAVTVGMDGQSVWAAGPLQAIHKLSDFAAVIILTDNADTGRNWIEQAGPQIGSTPMLMVISAQAEPMIRPFFDSGQLQGLVSGLSDAKIYEQSNLSLGPTHQFGLDNQYWDSFSVGLLVAELIILAGGLAGVIMDWRARHKNSGEEA